MAVTGGQTTLADTERAAEDAFVFGYPLVLMGRLRDGAARNAFQHQRPEEAPLAAALQSTAWVDVDHQPVVLSVPATHGHYYALSLADMWTDVFASIGPRTTGTGAGHYAICGPSWNGGALPPGLLPITAPTCGVRVCGVTQLDHRTGGRVARTVQDGFRLERLSAWRRHGADGSDAIPPGPAAPSAAEVAAQVDGMDAVTFVTELSWLLFANPPRPEGRAVVSRLRETGVLAHPGQGWERPAATETAIECGVERGRQRVRAAARETGPDDCWRVDDAPRPTSTDFLCRAACAYRALRLTSSADEIPATLHEDRHGEPLTGARRYEIRFEPGEAPPVHAFWSLTTCDLDASRAGPRGRLSSDDGLTTGTDGSLSIHVQVTEPVAREQRSNWLPAPSGPFRVELRLFWPCTDVLTRGWSPPAIDRRG
jgi:hypothetical protein